jgi:hypothetical protein
MLKVLSALIPRGFAPRILVTCLVIGALFFAFTPFYGVSYLIAVLLGAARLTSIGAFSTYVSRIVLAGLLLGASIMLSGLIAWLVQIEVHALLVIAVYFSLLLVTRIGKVIRSDERAKLFDKNDLIAIALSLIAPIVLISSFGLSSASFMQMAKEGWDNGSHVLMLQDAGIENGYLYGPEEELGDRVIWGSQGYPQAWHLATADIANGFGSSNVFSPDEPVRTTFVYVTVLIGWLVIASYTLARVSLFLATAFTKRRLTSLPEYVIFLAVFMLIQAIVLWASYNSGFGNFLGMLTYITVLIASLLDKKGSIPSAVTGLIMGTAAILCWFLTAPALLFVMLFAFAKALGFTRLRQLFKNIGRKHLWLLVGSLLALAPVLLQVAIFVLFASASGADQLNAGTTIDASGYSGSVIPVSYTLFVLAALFTAWYWWKHSKVASAALLAIVPFVVLVICLYVYQEASVGHASYYLAKILATALLVIGIFLAPAFAFWVFDSLKKFKQFPFAPLSLGLLIIGLVLVFTNQSLYGASHLLEKNTRVNKPTAQALVEYLKSADASQDSVVVMRADPDKPHEDYNGRFEMRVVHQPLNCSYHIRNRGAPIEEWLGRLEACADKLAQRNKSITVITSNRTTKLVAELHLSNVKIIEVKDPS